MMRLIEELEALNEYVTFIILVHVQLFCSRQLGIVTLTCV
jgi:hypothetical protein